MKSIAIVVAAAAASFLISAGPANAAYDGEVFFNPSDCEQAAATVRSPDVTATCESRAGDPSETVITITDLSGIRNRQTSPDPGQRFLQGLPGVFSGGSS